MIFVYHWAVRGYFSDSLLEMLIKFGAMYEMPSGYTIQQRFLEIFQPTKPFLAPLRQLLATELEIKASLLEQIPELDPLLNQWALPLATPG